ncbi:hypothetical protein M407DRAFT_27718 [Tulasnella calospora MUT 4182]|uniref:Xylanolytic transcriptional activator regulatory domain-containing protein n=1 Tax=Tulasnella calospora MUT 4182 TaxID=1051891 RepID=A0A0C3QDD3_9AGAM|nr:hypothetical protein M407DRAFT_27718 [Tulasnella calospora MUT 4182]
MSRKIPVSPPQPPKVISLRIPKPVQDSDFFEDQLRRLGSGTQMPRAAPSGSSSGMLKRYQRRSTHTTFTIVNQCRKQKLKWQVWSHAYAIRVDPLNAPSEPNCTYDDPDVKATGPKARITALEAENAELRALLQLADAKLAQCTCGAAHMYQSHGSGQDVTSLAHSDSVSLLGNPTLTTPPQPTPALATSTPSPTSNSISGSISIGALLVPPKEWDAPLIGAFTAAPPTSPAGSPGSYELTTDIWPLNIPPPETLYHLVETFFSSIPLATRLIHKPTFMARLRQVPTSPEFPHVSLLHAICGIASLYSPVIEEPRRDSPLEGYPARPFASGIISRPKGADGVQGKPYYPRRTEDILGPTPQSFGATHIQWAAETLKVASRVGDRLLQQVQASIIITWYYYSTGVIIRCYAWIGTVTNFVALLGLHVSEGFEPLSRFPAKMLFLLGSPKSHIEAETVRNVFWIAYVLERIFSGGTVWPLQISDEDVSQLMPCRLSDFVSGTFVPIQGRQTIFSENIHLQHPSLTTDPWTLYIKATILISRVKTFNGRYRIKSKVRPSGIPISPAENEEFHRLDQAINEFTQHIPSAFREPVETTVDPILYMAHLLPYVASIQLHDPHANVNEPTNVSTLRLFAAVHSMLDLVHKVLATSFDLIYLDHSTSFGWFVAGATIIRFLKAATEQGNQNSIWQLTQNLQTIKFVLGNLGERTTVGLRQIKLLNDLYDDEVVPASKRNAGQLVQLQTSAPDISASISEAFSL